ncbi:tripartite tricarboxylate transporter substrate binding protein [Aquincola tertiaricarbonis]|uniref:Tripartite tricarboxylate transporter substrate binding protein n=1 Tax=Aquincola tertiaricarbonis TaxID=391953 RepID=A0ABY4S527_AQUTE|nr:tripartite tricarboxylate transporter substrate binding protein [Aquincola tertiaricarbonis]URI06971.1 tripartite tricarboxylate transporter substrate binding protein [Aquincola tertiaricarbonis]
MTTFFKRRRRAALGTALLAATAGWLPAAVQAQPAFPSRPITLIVPFAPGGIADVTARAVAEAMGQTLKQTVVVDNRPSAGSIVASQAVASAKPDGHTLLLMSNGNAVSVGLFKKLPYDTLKDLQPISTLGFFDLGIVVPANSPFKTLPDLLRHAQAQPGALKTGTIAVGSTQHLAAKLFETVAGVQLLTVPYKGSPAVLMALRSGEIDVALEIVGPMMAQLKAGEIRALATTASQRNAALPDVPTVQQAGLKGYDVSSWNAIAAPAGTPQPVIDALQRAIASAVADGGVRTRLEALGMRLQSSTPTQARELLAKDIQRWGAVIKAAGIQPE